MYAVTPQPKIRNGAKYYDLLVTPTTSHLTTATVNDKEKLVFPDSMFSIGLVTHSWKYGSELQFVAFSRKPPMLEKRVDKEHSYYRLECGYLPGTHETANKLREIANQLDAIIGYSEPVVSYSTKPKKEIKFVADILAE
jgi:hypothetical protein